MAFYRGADCCALVFDVNNLKSFEQLDNWRDEFLTQANARVVDSFPFILIGNKVDVDEGKRQITQKRAKQWALDRGRIPYYETSAKEGIHVVDAFMDMANCALKKEVVDFDYDVVRVDQVNSQGAAGGSNLVGGCC